MIEGERGVRQSMNQGLRTSVLAGLLLAASVSHAAIAGGTAVPALRSSAAFVLDTTHSSVLYSRRSDVAVPIASITKLMTALVVLEAAQPLDEPIEVTAEDRGHGRGAGCPARPGGAARPARPPHAPRRGAEAGPRPRVAPGASRPQRA